VTRFLSRAGHELPAEFSPPEKAAERIAALNTVAEREALWLRMPEDWRPMIEILAVHAMASRIADMPQKFDRQNAIASVPELWREQVKALVISFWQTRESRAQYQAELRARRERESRRAA